MYDKNKTLDTLKNEIFLSKDNLYLAEEALNSDQIPYETVKKIMEVGGYRNKINALRKAYLMGVNFDSLREENYAGAKGENAEQRQAEKQGKRRRKS